MANARLVLPDPLLPAMPMMLQPVHGGVYSALCWDERALVSDGLLGGLSMSLLDASRTPVYAMAT